MAAAVFTEIARADTLRQARVQFTSVRISKAVLDSLPAPSAGVDASDLLARLAKSGAAVHRSEMVTVTDRMPATVEQALGAASGAMAVVIPRFTADGGVMLSISMTDFEPAAVPKEGAAAQLAVPKEGAAAQLAQAATTAGQFSAVRTFSSTETLLLSSPGTQAAGASGPETLVFVTLRLPAAKRDPSNAQASAAAATGKSDTAAI
jgi:hypothetical protein